MYVTQEKLVKIFFIVVTICIILAIGFFVTGKLPEELFAEKKEEKEGFDLNTSGITFTGSPIITSESGETVYQFKDTQKNSSITFQNTTPPNKIRVVAVGGGGSGTVTDISNILISRKTTLGIHIGIGNTRGNPVTNGLTTGIFKYYDEDEKLIPSDIPDINAYGGGDRMKGGSFTVYVSFIADPDASNNVFVYNRNNPDVQYHDSIEDNQKSNNLVDASFGEITVMDKNQQMITLPYVPGAALPTYFQPGTYRYGSSNYVPLYEDSVYLSRTSDINQLGKAYESSSQKAGFCNQSGTFSSEIEAKCGKLDQNTCASVSCCVLFGGSKCVAGDENGPKQKSNYTDPFVINKDVYYYQGKCYGNCV